ncbi:hypothetical protein [Dapis sp. BLCC M229]|uniref:hypothetical protein n=1 Tax=Dapis sp. BLCC M229 TaxID=3400188 RepID=UPI003CF346C5
MFRKLELPELVIHTQKEYINLSLVLVTNQKLCWHYRQKIQQKIASNPQFLDSHGCAKEIGELLNEMINNQHWRRSQDSRDIIKSIGNY